MPITSTIIGTSRDDLELSLLISTDSGSITVNAPGGLQRIINEYKLKMTKIKGTVFTHFSPTTIEGAIGMILTLVTANASAKQSDIGANSTKPKPHCMIGPADPKYIDGHGEASVDYNVWVNSASNCYECQPFTKVLPDMSFCAFPTTIDKLYAGYVFNFDPLPGKFDITKAKNLGIPKGPLFSALTKGNSVTLPDGRVINSSQVVSPPIECGSIVIFPDVVDNSEEVDFSCLDTYFYSTAPSVMYISFMTIESIENSCAMGKKTQLYNFFERFLSSNDKNKVIVYGCKYGKSVPRLLQSTAKFPSLARSFSARRFISMASNCQQQNLSNKINDVTKCTTNSNLFDCMPCTWEATEQLRGVEENALNNDFTASSISQMFRDGKVFQAIPISTYNISPMSVAGTINYNYSPSTEEYNKQYLEQHPVNEETLNSIKGIVDGYCSRNANNEKDNNEKPSITVLGTGSSMPSKYRNVSGNLISYKGSYIIVDCGESTYTQIMRCYGEEYFIKNILPNITHIFITHDHADHFFGVPVILYKFLLLGHMINRKISLEVYAPSFSLRYFRGACALIDNGIYKTISRSFNNFIKFNEIKIAYPHFEPEFIHIPRMGAHVSAVRVPHTEKSFAFIVSFPDPSANEMFLFGGDGYTYITLVEGVERAFRKLFNQEIDYQKTKLTAVLENTFAKGLEMDAFQKRHSTTLDAYIAARVLSANTLILVHMSQRYQKIAPVELFDFDFNKILDYDNISEENETKDNTDASENENENENNGSLINKKVKLDLRQCTDGCRINIDASMCENIVSMGLRVKKDDETIVFSAYPCPFKEDPIQSVKRNFTIKREKELYKETGQVYPLNIIWGEDLMIANSSNAEMLAEVTNLLPLVFLNED